MEAPPVSDPAPSAGASADAQPPPAGAAPASEPSAGEDFFSREGVEEDGESLLGTLVRTFLVLGVVICCIYIVLNFGLRRMMGLKAAGASSHSLIAVVDRVPLDPKHALLVVKAAGEYLLLGTGEGGLRLISKLQTEEVERLQRERALAPGALSPFLQKLLSRGGHPPPSA